MPELRPWANGVPWYVMATMFARAGVKMLKSFVYTLVVLQLLPQLEVLRLLVFCTIS
jgi:hypothetical protein